MSDLNRRTSSGQFAPGASGNRKGRPKLAPAIRDACREATPEVIKAWKTEVKSKGPDWVAVSKLLMAYGWGSPTATVEVSRDEDPPAQRTVTIDPKRLSLAELEAYRVVMRAHARLTAHGSASASTLDAELSYKSDNSARNPDEPCGPRFR